MADPNHYSSWGVGAAPCGGLTPQFEHYRAADWVAKTGEWKAIVPRWLYNRFIEQFGEDVVSRMFEPVDDWSVDDATF